MTPTPSQTIGPFFGFALPFSDDAAAAPSGSPDTLRIEGQVLDGAGDPVPDALLEISENDQFARCRTDAEGAFHFIVRKPNEAFFSMTVFARGLLRHLNTRMYLPDAEDPVLSSVDPKRRHTLVAQREGGTLHFDVRLQGPDETVFFAID
ncbi:MAG: protocatechuate 3,4-dioxygenase subunit alpha [Chloroflexi bacterium]|nr:MAG: protocatechuate 3,4-dioxygenase subunit alpha [Chloroflexota bacterium]